MVTMFSAKISSSNLIIIHITLCLQELVTIFHEIIKSSDFEENEDFNLDFKVTTRDWGWPEVYLLNS